MKVIDLSQTINKDMSVFPGANPPKISQVANIADDYYVEHHMEFTTHIGTHIDSPAHIVDKGNILIDLDVNQYVGKGLVLDVSNNESITAKDLQSIAAFDQIEFLLLYTGLGELFNTDDYLGDFPVLSKDGVAYILEHGHKLKGIGVDCFSIDTIEPLSIDNHIPILKHGLIIIENLCNLKSIINEEFTLSVLPLKASHIEGSPVRAVALVKED